MLSKQVPGNIVNALGGKGKRKENNFSKEVVFTKADESSSEPTPEITFDSETDYDTQEPLPKVIEAESFCTSNSLISLLDLTSNMAELTLNNTSKKSKKSFDKVSQTYVMKKTEPKEVKGIKDHIKIPSITSSSGSQASSSKPSKQKVWYGPCIHCGLKNHLFDDYYSKTKCSTRGSNNHLTKEHTEQTAVKRTLNKLKNQPPLKPTPKKTFRMSNPSSECKYHGSNKHHPDNCEFYPGCEICGSIAHEITDYPKNLRNNRKQRIANKQSTKPTEKYSKESGLKVVFGDDSLGDTEGYSSVNCNEITFTRVAYVNENLNEVRVKEQRNDNGTEFKNHKLEEFYDEKEAVNTARYTQNRSIIVKRHGKTTYDVFRGRSLDISYFYVFRCPVHIHNHRDHLGKFDEKADDGFFLGYSLVAKAFKVFNIRRQEMEEIVHVTFSEDDDAISKSSTEGDAIKFNENRSFPDDEFLEPRNKATQCSANIEYFPYISAYENITPANSLTLQDSVSSEDPPEFTVADNHPALSELDHPKSADNLEPTEIQDNVSNEPISDIHHSPSHEDIHLSLVPQERWSREKHIELVNIIGEPLAGITTRSKVRDSESASAHECLYVNFFLLN
ncbi:retrovirus-related pol polyprotein from transposon TNT 1-94 [Tanacetum coccineum]